MGGVAFGNKEARCGMENGGSGRDEKLCGLTGT